ncbi:DUF747-domain-containing protein [Piedraia hortae CBS 480.64]|uniref:DUF747-domain-containing protein n=1 Tax=Piedraia hortae CBS 480.64 TaxID=1314780 RepID=A0A6A7C1J6_9PEZI|nr:DUF747-domain-containing protein [Piedraia hortae CBS 480.64]
MMPLPPMSLATFLQLELSSDLPSALYIQRPYSDFPYESSRVKFQRLLNFLLVPYNLEQVLWFGAVACLDAWLYAFTILPLRFVKAIAVLSQWFLQNIENSCSFIFESVASIWSRERRIRTPRKSSTRKHRRIRSTPSALLPNHKGDILQGLLIIVSCIVLFHLDASRMYHTIRGQSAIKLYVIYNVLEVFDRLLSAIGQDILECLVSPEILERNEQGRSRILRPVSMFLLALSYNVAHSTALFYQVITLNVAVNSYSYALLTLLLSNQFVEIKGTVFKKFDKEALFQITCADIVERFQLWLFLLIITLRNIVEVGGFIQRPYPPLTTPPNAFTIIPNWTSGILSPFLIVLGSEALVDWIKHAYINKFNNLRPAVYGRYLDVLAKDYYAHAFLDQNLMKRLGLPVIPLSCLFIRACLQCYRMLAAVYLPPTSAEIVAPRSRNFAALEWVLGARSAEDAIAFAAMLAFFGAGYFVLLAAKLVLGMGILRFARRRYARMDTVLVPAEEEGAKRSGGWGVVEVQEDKRAHIYGDDPQGLSELREREERGRRAKKGDGVAGVMRYKMVGKRIW